MGGIALAAALLGGGLGVTLTPNKSSGGATSGGHCPTVTAIVSGGSGAITYAWTLLSGDPFYALTINSPAAAATDFDFAPVAPGGVATATVRLTITRGAETAHVDCQVRFFNRLTP